MPKVTKQALEKQAGSFALTLVRGGLVALILWLIFGAMDWYDPWIELKPEQAVLGPRTEFLLEAGDKDSGLRDIRVSVVQSSEEKVIMIRTFSRMNGLFGYKGSKFTKIEMPVVADAKELGLKEGKAKIVVTAHDFSWRNRFQGRVTTLIREVEVSFSSRE